MINAGKPAKVALTAVMRKLILLANTLLKANRSWGPKTRLIKTDTLATAAFQPTNAVKERLSR